MRAATCRLISLASAFVLLAGTVHAQKTPLGVRPASRSGSGTTFGFTLGLTTGMFQPSPDHAQNVADYAIGFDMRVAVWPLRFFGAKAGAGVDFFRGPEGPNGKPAGGSYGLADVALAFRTRPPRNGTTFGLDAGVATVFEPDYSYSYTEGNTIYVYPSIELPLAAVRSSRPASAAAGWSGGRCRTGTSSAAARRTRAA